jgi:hypothetical protein
MNKAEQGGAETAHPLTIASVFIVLMMIFACFLFLWLFIWMILWAFDCAEDNCSVIPNPNSDNSSDVIVFYSAIFLLGAYFVGVLATGASDLATIL